MTLQFGTTDRITADGVKVCVYGPAGVGKTVLCGTAPAPIIINAERGLLSLAGKRIPYIEVNSLSDVKDAYLWLTTSREAAQIQTACIDSISDVAEAVIHSAKKKFTNPMQAYGFLAEELVPLLKDFRNIRGKHVVYVATMEKNTDELSRLTRYGPSFPGQQLSRLMPYIPDEVFHMGIGTESTGETYRYLRTQPNMQYEAKDRSGRLAELEYPDLTNIFNKIAGAT